MYFVSSDIHLEFFKKYQVDIMIKKVNEVMLKYNNIIEDKILLLAGDICTIKNDNLVYFLENIQNMFAKIIYVPGNHEYYGLSITEGNRLLKEKIEKLNESNNNIILLNNGSHYDDKHEILIIGTSLWSNLAHNNYDIILAKYMINDFRYIQDFKPQDYLDMFNSNLKFLERELENNRDTNKIIITHHMPSYDLIAEEYKGEINVCFASDLNYLFNSSIKAWIYGHTHCPTEKILNDTLCKCNPIGYKGENTNFKVIDILKL